MMTPCFDRLGVESELHLQPARTGGPLSLEDEHRRLALATVTETLATASSLKGGARPDWHLMFCSSAVGESVDSG